MNAIEQQILAAARSSRRPRRLERHKRASTRAKGGPRARPSVCSSNDCRSQLRSIESRAMSDRPDRPRDARDHEAVPRRARERRRRLRPPRGRGARAPRRERRRQVDADEHPLRPLPARTRARSEIDGEPVRISARRRRRSSAGIGMVHQHFMLIPVMTVAENIVLAAEPTQAGVLLDYAAARSACARPRVSVRTSPSTRRRAIEDITVGQQQRVEILKALYRRRRHPRSSTSRPRC